MAPHRSYTSVVSAMLGQHPQMYGLPEMNLFVAENMSEWWAMFRQGTAIGVHGPLRVVAEIYGQEQTEQTIREAWNWLRQRLNRDTGSIFREIAEQVDPLAVVEKSPTTVYRVEYMERARRVFPRAKFLHLLRHPLGHGQSVLKAFEEFDQFGALPRGLGNSEGARPVRPRPGIGGAPSSSRSDDGLYDYSTDPPTLDPQMRWYKLQTNIRHFLSALPPWQWMQIRGEDLMADPDLHLRDIASWLGFRTDPEAIEQMKHPERSPYACFGPPNAHLGNDPNFLQKPALRAGKSATLSLDAPVPWRKDGMKFRPEVQALARQFGYV
ncbi:MAG TPA: sulfotransferase [Nitrospiria bacterium]|nr:sulfotransferase [Nitrospiria bacterium]